MLRFAALSITNRISIQNWRGTFTCSIPPLVTERRGIRTLWPRRPFWPLSIHCKYTRTPFLKFTQINFVFSQPNINILLLSKMQWRFKCFLYDELKCITKSRIIISRVFYTIIVQHIDNTMGIVTSYALISWHALCNQYVLLVSVHCVILNWTD